MEEKNENNKFNLKFTIFACFATSIILVLSMHLGQMISRMFEYSDKKISDIVEKENNYDGTITSFSYSYGGYNSGYYNYNIIVDNEKIILSARGGNGVELNIDKEIEISNLTLLAQIINEKGICNWNGFEEKNDQVLDGNSFKLEVVYSDGKTLKANGYMKYPENYNIGHEALVEFFGKFN